MINVVKPAQEVDDAMKNVEENGGLDDSGIAMIN